MSKLESINKLKVACILDEFSYHCFKYECELIPITPENWLKVLSEEKPTLLLVESAWSGNNGAWTDKLITRIKDIILLVAWCRTNNITTVFWNKEDPFSFEQFINIAKWFDIIFTTDVGCINKYKERIDHHRVYLLPFAAQPAIHNPIEIYEKRKTEVSFAGTNYAAKFPEREKDMERIFSIVEPYGLDIYDRHFGENLNQFFFPEKYRPYIREKLNGEEIVKAYKGYNFSINLNSIKNSYTMFARRVFELIASNTVVISSYSTGMKEILGNLTICSDNEVELKEKFSRLLIDNLYYKKYRLFGLREVLKEHTYRERFAYIVEKALNQKLSDKWQSVAVLGFASNIQEFNAIYEQFERQTYKNKLLYIFCLFECEDIEYNNIFLYCYVKYKHKKTKDIIHSNYISYFHKDDYYGENYLTDLMCVPLYAECDGFGKSSYYQSGTSLTLCNESREYRFVDQLQYRCSVINIKNVELLLLDKLFKSFNEDVIEYATLFSADIFNYLYNGTLIYKEEYISTISDLNGISKGIEINLIEKLFANQSIVNRFLDYLKLDLSKFMICNESKVQIKIASTLIIHSELTSNEHRYLFYDSKSHNFEKIPHQTQLEVNSDNEYLISISGEKEAEVIISLVIVTYSKDKKKDAYYMGLNTNKILSFSPDIEKIIFCLRIQGTGTSTIYKIHVTKRKKILLDKNKSNYLILTNIYPSYDNLYQNGFVHRRVKNYLEQNLSVDVFMLSYYERLVLSQYEFDSVRIYKGYKDELRSLLRSGKYEKVLVHFINPDMYEVLKEFLDVIKIIVWIHGAEAQPWSRRAFEYLQNSDLSQVIASSNTRMAFIKDVMKDSSMNIHFVFISDTFRKEVEEDISFQLNQSKYSIIHNIIDTKLFMYTEKKPEHRKKILSISSFASRKYANDLRVKAILELSKKDYFNDLEFCFYGKGILFNETIEPLRQFMNIKIHEKFLTQNEVAEIHKEYGIFLIPTRCDSQGVSRDEAMASGLVPITNNVSSIPEFLNEHCGMLVAAEDYKGLAEAIEYLYYNPEEFMKKSKNASQHVKDFSGKEVTIDKEIKLIKEF